MEGMHLSTWPLVRKMSLYWVLSRNRKAVLCCANSVTRKLLPSQMFNRKKKVSILWREVQNHYEVRMWGGGKKVNCFDDVCLTRVWCVATNFDQRNGWKENDYSQINTAAGPSRFRTVIAVKMPLVHPKKNGKSHRRAKNSIDVSALRNGYLNTVQRHTRTDDKRGIDKVTYGDWVKLIFVFLCDFIILLSDGLVRSKATKYPSVVHGMLYV